MAILRSPLLAGVHGIEHGFGTREAPISQEGMVTLKQIHSTVVRIGNSPGCVGEGDGLLTDVPGTTLSVRTADCLPLLLSDTAGLAIGALHAGWRGTADGIVGEAVSLMRSRFGTRPETLQVAIGPGIGLCCYEVGEEVARRFGLDTRGKIDLADANRRQLIDAGVPESQIEMLGLCTFCDQRFHSYRRDKDRAGRMISFIRLRP